MEESLFEDPHGILHRTLVFRLPDLGRQDHGLVVFRPLRVILVQFRFDPVPVYDDGLFAVVTDNERRNTFEIRKSMVVDLDPFCFFCGEHPFRVDVLRIRKYRHENNDRIEFSGQAVGHFESLPGEVDLDLFTDDCVPVQ